MSPARGRPLSFSASAAATRWGPVTSLLNAGAVTAREAERLLAFCNNTGPAFFLGALGGGVFRSPRLGARLYLAHIAAAVLTGLLLRPRETPSEPKARPDVPALPFSRALPQAVGQAVTALVNVCGFVVCFAVFTGLLNANGFYAALSERLCRALPLQPQAVNALLTGFFELGGGIGALRGL